MTLIWYRNPETGARQATRANSPHHAILQRLPNWQREDELPAAEPAVEEPVSEPVKPRRKRRKE